MTYGLSCSLVHIFVVLSVCFIYLYFIHFLAVLLLAFLRVK